MLRLAKNQNGIYDGESYQKRYLQSSSKIIFIIIISFSFFIRLIFLKKTNLFPEEAYYWNYSNHLDFSYLDHPPMVALLIKYSTWIFGTNEFGVRLPALLSWLINVLFSYKLSELFYKGSGFYVITLLSILPFFFFQSIFITPDCPLLMCWSAVLYYSYRFMVLDHKKILPWLAMWFGLGLLSKYTIVLLAPSSLLYLYFNKKIKHVFKMKETYFALLIILIFFSPVLYWNYLHDGASFRFHLYERFSNSIHFSLPSLFFYLTIFLTPLGLYALYQLVAKNKDTFNLSRKKILFTQIHTLIPLLFFSIISLKHNIRLNWIAPIILALLPWLATLIAKTKNSYSFNYHQHWLIHSIILINLYLIALISINYLSFPYKNKIFKKFIAWDLISLKINKLTEEIKTNTKKIPLIIPLDKYNIASELTFYQNKQLKLKTIKNIYPIIGAHVFGKNSLMYRYWYKEALPSNTPLLLIARNHEAFNLPSISGKIINKSPINSLSAYTQEAQNKVAPFFYQIISLSS